MFYLVLHAVLVPISVNEVSIADSNTINFNFNAYGVVHDLQLEKHSFLSNEFSVFQVDDSSTSEVHVEDCYYINDVASFKYCDKLQGTFYSPELNETLSIQPHLELYNITRNVTINLEDNWCHHFVNKTHFLDTLHPPTNHLNKRALTARVEVLAIVDSSMINTYQNATAQHILDVFQYMAAIYAQSSNFTIPIRMQLNGILLFKQPILDFYDTANVLGTTQSLFKSLISKEILPQPQFDVLRKADHATIFMSTSFAEQQVIGVANTPAMCQDEYSVSAVSEFNTNGQISSTGYAYAHELAHSLNSGHDGVGLNSYCPPGVDIMSPYILQSLPSTFSVCSINAMSYYVNAIQQGSYRRCLFIENGYSLSSNNVTICGNGIVDVNEECDGMGETSCCNSNCTLKVNAKCDDLNGNCCQSCQFKSNTTICRSSSLNPNINACTPVKHQVDYCSGYDLHCPIRQFYLDNELCSINTLNGFCNNGYCFTPQDVCEAFQLTLESCTSNTSCSIYCDDGGVCVDTQYKLPQNAKCGLGLNGTCNALNTCIYPSSTTTALYQTTLLTSKSTIQTIIQSTSFTQKPSLESVPFFQIRPSTVAINSTSYQSTMSNTTYIPHTVYSEQTSTKLTLFTFKSSFTPQKSIHTSISTSTTKASSGAIITTVENLMSTSMEVTIDQTTLDPLDTLNTTNIISATSSTLSITPKSTIFTFDTIQQNPVTFAAILLVFLLFLVLLCICKRKLTNRDYKESSRSRPTSMA